MNLAKFPRRRYTADPTPIDFLPRLTEHLGGPNLYLKRDDMLGLAGGGNKTRKLEFLMADALSQGADTIITTGAVQSNHCRLTLAAAVKEGVSCHLLLEERVPDSFDPDGSGNNLLFNLLGASRIDVVPLGVDIISLMESMADDVRSAGGHAYIVPGGGSNPLGALGYVACAEEILAQSFRTSISFDRVVCASGSGGTHAGLLAGLSSNQSGIPVIGISVRADRDAQEAKILALANETASLAGAHTEIPASEVEVVDSYVGAGYSLPTREMTKAIQLFARMEGVLLDPVYTGKTAAGLIGLTQAGRFAPEENVLLVHTGGSPALFAYPNAALANVDG
jgi:D-cysteine desulfhydrase